MKPHNISWPRYVRFGVGNRLSRLGERLNLHWLTYNPLVFLSFHEEAVRNAPAVIRTLRSAFPDAKRVLDVGAGSGAYAAEAIRQGLDAIACEHSSIARRMARRQGVDSRSFDLNRDPPAVVGGPFDLAYCFEVAEHLPPQLGERLVEFLARCAPTVVFTAAQPGQGGTGHINEQPAAYWIERFERANMRHDCDLSDRLRKGFMEHGPVANWLAANVLAFKADGRDRSQVLPRPNLS